MFLPSARHVELNSRFTVVTWIDQKSARASVSSVGSVSNFSQKNLKPLSEYLLSKVSARQTHSQERYQLVRCCQIDEFLIDLSLKSDDIQPLLQEELLALRMVLQIVFHTEFSHLPGSLGHFADSNSIPWNQTTIFHPILIEAILLTYFTRRTAPLSDATCLGSMRCRSAVIP